MPAAALPLGPEFRVGTQVFGNRPAVATTALGEFVVAWSSLSLQRFSHKGAPLGAELEVPIDRTFPEQSVAFDLNGDFVVVCDADDDDTSYNTGVFARRYLGGKHGDANGDGSVEVDVLYLITYLFAGGAPPLGPGDVNSDGVIDVADILYLINHLFASGPSPP